MLLKRMIIPMLTVLMIANVFTGCAKKPASDAKSSSDIKIGFLVKQPEELWFQNEWKFAQKCADTNGFDLKKIGAADGEKVLNAIDNLAAQGVKGFVICTPDVKLGPAIVAKAVSNGMKVYSVDDQFLGSDGKPMTMIPHMGISASAIGENVGKSLYEEFKNRKWDVNETGVCVITFEELPTAKERTDGAIAALKAMGFPENRIFKGAEKTPTIPAANDAANIVLTQQAKIKKWMICSMNDEGVLGAVRAMEGQGFTAADVIGIGIGGSTSMVEFEKSKPSGFFATCLISPKRHGYETTENLYKWIKDGTQPPKDIRTKGIMINRSNYKTIMKAEGLLD